MDYITGAWTKENADKIIVPCLLSSVLLLYALYTTYKQWQNPPVIPTMYSPYYMHIYIAVLLLTIFSIYHTVLCIHRKYFWHRQGSFFEILAYHLKGGDRH
jgi:hypothetical protein